MPSYRLMIVMLLMCSLFAGRAQGQLHLSVNPPEISGVFDALYKYDLVEAENKFNRISSATIDPGLMELTQVNLYWWWMISGDGSRDYDFLMTSVLKKTIGRLRLKPIERMTSDEVFFMIHSYAYLTRVDIFFNRYLKGIANLKQTLVFLKVALQQADRYDKYLLVSGLYHYFARVAMSKYPFLVPFFTGAPAASRELGYLQLSRCAEMKNILIRNEARYYLMKINYQLEDDFERSLKIADQLIAAYPNNLVYRYHRFTILLDSGRKKQALEEYQWLVLASATAPGLNKEQRIHFTDIALKQLRKQRVNPAI